MKTQKDIAAALSKTLLSIDSDLREIRAMAEGTAENYYYGQLAGLGSARDALIKLASELEVSLHGMRG